MTPPENMAAVYVPQEAETAKAIPYSDNVDHFVDLEQEAILRVALAHFRVKTEQRKDIGPPAQGERGDGKDRFADGLHIPQLGIVLSTMEDASIALKNVSENRLRREAAAEAKGTALGYCRLCTAYDLDEQERQIILLLYAAAQSPRFQRFQEMTVFRGEASWANGEMLVRTLLSIISKDYRSEFAGRKLFTVDSRLTRHGLIAAEVHQPNSWTGILNIPYHLHGHVARQVAGDPGVYHPRFNNIRRERARISPNHVVLPVKMKEEILALAERFSDGRRSVSRKELLDFFGYGTGLTFLFHGPSGTGKTMMAHAIATALGKELLTLNMKSDVPLVDYPISNGDLIQYVFREARLCGGIAFFDECDDLFQEGGYLSRTLLIELEKAETITILATNKPGALDAALERRITRFVEFPFPDSMLRERLWAALLPPGIKYAPGLDLKALACDYSISGGHIKNAILLALHEAAEFGRNTDGTLYLPEDLVRKAASRQAQRSLEDTSPGETRPPSARISDLPVRRKEKRVLSALSEVARERRDAGEPFHIIIVSEDLDTGVKAVEAVAAECGLWIRQADLVDVLTSGNEYRDPVRHRKVKAIDYIFSPGNEKTAVTVLVDRSELASISRMDGSEGRQPLPYIDALQDRLARSRGIHALVVRYAPSKAIISEFHHMLKLDPPSNADQFDRWQRHLGNTAQTHEAIHRLMEMHPMHIREIDLVARQAALIALVEEGQNIPDVEHVEDAIRRHRIAAPTPVLFGQGKQR